jgi:hypothetical protein
MTKQQTGPSVKKSSLWMMLVSLSVRLVGMPLALNISLYPKDIPVLETQAGGVHQT